MNEDGTQVVADDANAPVEQPQVQEQAPAAPEIQDNNKPVTMFLDNDAPADAPVDDTGDTGGEAPKQEEQKQEPIVEEKPPVQPQEPVVEEQVKQISDPGDFTPGDYSFEIKLADGSSIKITNPEEIENLPEDIEFASPAELIKAQANFTKMVTGIEADKAKYEASKEAFTEQQTAIQQNEQFITGIESGMKYLEQSGNLPAYDTKYDSMDWNDPEVAKQPGVKERIEIISYMAAENAKRNAAGVPPITSVIDAFNAMQLDSLRQQKTQADNAKKQATKARGAMVGGESSSSQGGAAPSNMIVGTGGSINDIGWY